MKGPEPIADELRAILREHMDAKLDELAAEYDDDVEVPYIATESFYLESPEGGGFSYPLVVIGEAAFVPAGASPEFLEATYQFAVDVWDTTTADGMEAMHRRLWRYSRAVVEVLRAHTRGSSHWTALTLENRRPSPILTTEDEREYYRAKGALVGVLVGEDY